MAEPHHRTEPLCPTELHGRVLDDLLTELRADRDVRGVLIGGSLARGTARPDSDIDVLVVTSTGREDHADQPWRTRERPLPIDLLVRTADSWREHFAPQRVGDESWGYCFLDGVPVHDPDGVVAELVRDAAAIHAGYRVPDSVKAHYAWLWRHVKPKLVKVIERDNPVEIGWSAAVMTNELVRTVWAANDLPNPSLDLGTFQRHLDDLTRPADVPDRIRDILRARPRLALSKQLELVDLVLPYLTGSVPDR